MMANGDGNRYSESSLETIESGADKTARINLSPPVTPSRNEEINVLKVSPKKADASIKKSSFTHEQTRYEAGLTGVYINPRLKGSMEPTRGRPIKRPRLVVFKSESLRDPAWLEKKRGSWHEHVAEAIASQIIDAENNTHVPPKRRTGETKRRQSHQEPQTEPKRRRTIRSSNNPITTPDLQDTRETGTQLQTISLDNTPLAIKTNKPNLYRSSQSEITAVSATQILTSRDGQETRIDEQDLLHNKVSCYTPSLPSESTSAAPEEIDLSNHGHCPSIASSQTNLSPRAVQFQSKTLQTKTSDSDLVATESSLADRCPTHISFEKEYNPSNQDTPMGHPDEEHSLNQNVEISHHNYTVQNSILQKLSQNLPPTSIINPSDNQIARSRAEVSINTNTFDRATHTTSDVLTARESENFPSMQHPNYHTTIVDSGLQHINAQILDKNEASSNLLVITHLRHEEAQSIKKLTQSSAQESQETHNTAEIGTLIACVSENQSPKDGQSQPKQQCNSIILENCSRNSKTEPRRRTRASESIAYGDPDLEKAAAVNFSPEMSRLICRYQNKAGNLLLSANKQLLEFFSIDQDHSLLNLEISRIPQNPITSIAGSKPMQLRVKALNQCNEVDVHVFEFLDTIRASEAANNMRANIVTGIVACKFRSGEDYSNPLQIKEKIQKPYQCQSCDKRFKNQNGLEYHVSKAATTCNPNFDPEVGPGKRGRKKRKYTPEAVTGESMTGPTISPSTNIHHNDHETSNDESESTNESGTSSSSDDSIIMWAMQNSTSGVERLRKDQIMEPSPTSIETNKAIYRALPREAAVLSDIVEELSTRTSEVKLPSLHVIITDIIPTFADRVSLTGTLDVARYESLLLSIVKANNGFFPGDKSLWVACISLWLKENTKSSSGPSLITAPESKVCCQLIDNLVQSTKLKRHIFKFKDKSGRQVSRYFVTIPGSETNWTQIKEAQTSMKEAYPDYYVPLQFSPPENVLTKLRGLFNRSRSSTLTHQISEDIIHPSFSPVPDKLDPDQSIKTNDNAKIVKSGNEKNRIITKSHISKTKNSCDENRKNRNAKISEGLRRYHQSLGKPPKRRKEITKPKRREDHANLESVDATTNKQSCDSACLLQNSELGAGSQVLSKCTEKDRLKSDFSRLLIEQITCLQGAAGTWSVPIPSYSLTRTYSNSLQNYRETSNSLVLLREKSNSSQASISTQDKNPVLNALQNSLANKMISKGRPSPKSTVSGKERQKNGIKGCGKPRSPTKKSCQPILSSVEGAEGINSPVSRIISISERAKRYNTRQNPNVDFESESEDDTLDLYNLRANTSSNAPATAGLCEMEILSLYEPKKRPIEASHNPGIETLPSSFGILSLISNHNTKANLENSKEKIVPEILIPNVIDSECNFDNGSWTVTDLVLYKSDKYNVRFDCQTAFNVESLPYRELCFALSIEKTVPVTPYNLTQQQSRTPIRRKQDNVKRLKFTRLLTHLNADFWGIGCQPEASSKFLGIPVAAGDEIAKLRKRNSHDSMSLTVEKRFIIAVVIIRALTGGIECLTDWVLVSLLFPRFSLNFIRGHWKQLVIRHKKAIDRLETDFQDAFITAYESGKIPTIDYDHLQDYNWNKLIDWTISNVDTSFSHKPVSIPNSRIELNDRFSIEILDSKDNWRDKWFETNAATYRRLDYACFNSLAIPIRDKAKRITDDGSTELSAAKSWIRAMALTPDDQSSVEAAQKFGKKISQQALSDLIRDKVIMFRSKKRVNLSSRDYEATELFSRPLRREVKPKCFRDASVFKRYLDSEFKNGSKSVRVDYLAWEGDVMVISNLQAYKRIELQAIGVPREKFGLTEGGYETKKIPRERLRFEMDIHPTPNYIYEDQNQVVLKALNDGPPRGNQLAIPVWYSASETIIRSLWKEIYSAVSQVMALRAGVDIQELTRIFTPTMEEWEIKLLVSWGERLGLFCRLHERIDGWIAGEWWWAYAMALHAEDRFTVGQDVRYEPDNPFTMEGRRSG